MIGVGLLGNGERRGPGRGGGRVLGLVGLLGECIGDVKTAVMRSDDCCNEGVQVPQSSFPIKRIISARRSE